MIEDQKVLDLLKKFSSKDDAIKCCEEICKIFNEYHPPLVANYWNRILKKLKN